MKTTLRRPAFLHNLDKAMRPQRFDFLSGALRAAWDQKASGYIVDPEGSVINIRKGKRRSTEGKWVRCDVGCLPLPEEKRDGTLRLPF